MAISLFPSESYHSIYEIDIQSLKNDNIKLLLLDLDNTLIAYGEREPNEKLRQWMTSLQEAGVVPFVLSNSRKPTRVKHFATLLGIPFVGWAGKPKKKSFLQVMKQMNVSTIETVMVGDQIFTDILGANRVGIRSIIVEPIQKDTLFRKLRYSIEKPFRQRALQIFM